MPGGPPIIPMRLQPLPEFKPFEQPVIAHDKVRYVGEPIAVVLADSVAIGEDALEAIEVEIEALAGGGGLARRAAQDTSLLFEAAGHQPLAGLPGAQGRRRRGLRDAPYVRRERLRTGRHYGLTMEPRGVMARVGRGQGQAHGVGRRQGAVLQPPHPGEADRPAGRRRSR